MPPAQDRVAVALGGDGLAGRVAGACVLHGALFAALPGGRGNDFVRGLGVEHRARWRRPGNSRSGPSGRPISAMSRVLTGSARAFLGIASLGFDSDVQVRANRTRLIRGSSVYTYAALRTLAGMASRALHRDALTTRRPKRSTGWSVAAANSAVLRRRYALRPVREDR